MPVNHLEIETTESKLKKNENRLWRPAGLKYKSKLTLFTFLILIPGIGINKITLYTHRIIQFLINAII